MVHRPSWERRASSIPVSRNGNARVKRNFEGILFCTLAVQVKSDASLVGVDAMRSRPVANHERGIDCGAGLKDDPSSDLGLLLKRPRKS